QGRAEIRDVLEARESLISARNALTSALVDYRVAELELQRDLGVLEVGADGLWRELSPDTLGPAPEGPASPDALPRPDVNPPTQDPPTSAPPSPSEDSP
ncbi:MAG: hypothetical protein ACOC3G_07975, partial [Phycisphaeraceae bacterium]